MNARGLVMITAAVAVAGCGAADSRTKAEFCAEMPAAVCARLFDEACALIPAGDAPRYPSKDGCETQEAKACDARAADSRLSFDGAKAASCLTQLADDDCQKAARADFHDCDTVFAEGDAGVGVIHALDAGGDGGPPEDGGDR